MGKGSKSFFTSYLKNQSELLTCEYDFAKEFSVLLISSTVQFIVDKSQYSKKFSIFYISFLNYLLLFSIGDISGNDNNKFRKESGLSYGLQDRNQMRKVKQIKTDRKTIDSEFNKIMMADMRLDIAKAFNSLELCLLNSPMRTMEESDIKFIKSKASQLKQNLSIFIDSEVEKTISERNQIAGLERKLEYMKDTEKLKKRAYRLVEQLAEEGMTYSEARIIIGLAERELLTKMDRELYCRRMKAPV